jgi:DNA-directed RNA polymerase specialized sigma24 family protein
MLTLTWLTRRRSARRLSFSVWHAGRESDPTAPGCFMSNAGAEASVTIWIGDLKSGGDSAAQKLWERYCDRLANLARQQIRNKLPGGGMADEQDAALSAFDSFCQGARRGAYPRLDDRDDLWRLLAVLTTRKVADLARTELAVKRGGGKVKRQYDLTRGTGGAGASDGLEAARVPRAGVWIEAEPGPEELAIQAEEFRRVLDGLGDPVLREIALAKLEGLTDEEIAERFTKSRKWVQRKLAVIRERLRGNSD